MSRIGKYKEKSFSKYRQNIVFITKEGWRKRTTHSMLEIDVTNAQNIIRKNKEKNKKKISFTSWVIKCVAQVIGEHKEFNAYRHGKKKIAIFDDVDIAIPVERSIDGEERPRVYILRKANKKPLIQITKEIRAVQAQDVSQDMQLLGDKVTRAERFVLNSPCFVKKFVLWFTRNNAFFKKKHMGTTSVTAIGMIGKFPGWVIPMGGIGTTLFVVGGITKKPGVVDDKIKIREYLHLTISADHDLIDGGPLVRFVDRLNELMENAFGLEDL